MTITQIVLGTLPLMLTILGAAIHLGVRIGRFQQALLGVEKIQETIANDLVTHMSHDEKLFGELNSALRGYADSLNRLVGAVTGKAT